LNFNGAGHSEETLAKPKGEAAKQRASEQLIFTNLSLDKVCMKMWCYLNRDPANKWREYDRCGVAFPWPMSKNYFGENHEITATNISGHRSRWCFFVECQIDQLFFIL